MRAFKHLRCNSPRTDHPMLGRLADEAKKAVRAIPKCCGTECKVYFLAGGELVKVGSSTLPEKRLLDLQMCSPVRLTLVAVSHGTADLERQFHALLAPFREHGEWFRRRESMAVLKPIFDGARGRKQCLRCEMAKEHERRAALFNEWNELEILRATADRREPRLIPMPPEST